MFSAMIMKLECQIRIEDKACPERSFKRFVNCNLYIGVSSKASSSDPQLYLRTSNNTHHYKIRNNIQSVRGTMEKDTAVGKATIEFYSPNHYLMINCEREKLEHLLKFLRKLSKHVNCKTFQVVAAKDLKKPTSKLKIADAVDSTSLKGVPNIPPFFLSELKQQPCLWKALLTSNLRKLELKSIAKIEFPVMLGRIPLFHVSLTCMDLKNNDLLWLNEVPIRKSLTVLNLSNTKLGEFPMVITDCLSLNSLDLSYNKIDYIPHNISRLRKLRSLQMSHNRLHYLPGDIQSLYLDNIDLAFNRLYSNLPVSIKKVDSNFRGRLRLEDWAALNFDLSVRFQLTSNDCPEVLLKRLRSLSRCICGKVSPRSLSTEYFVPLPGVRFAASSCVEPQCDNNRGFRSIVYLQYHFCTFHNHCVDKKFKATSANASRLIKLGS